MEQREALEAALVANPDDVAAHSAYADLLIEAGDPRGDFIRVQLALETAPEGPARDDLLTLEQTLLDEHRDAWLGSLVEPLQDVGATYTFRRGWLDDLELPTIRAELADQLAAAPELRLLRRFAIVDPFADELDPAVAYGTHVLVGTAWFEEEEEVALVPLLESQHLGNVRVFQLGDAGHERCGVGDGPVAGLIEKMPQLEELHLFLWKLDEAEDIFARDFSRLRVLRVGGVFSYPVTVLAENATLGALEELTLQPASPGGHQKLWPDECAELVRSPHLTKLRHLRLAFLMGGDDVCVALAESGMLDRLQGLELIYSGITDAGADALLAAHDLEELEYLNLVGNHLSPDSIERLQAAGVTLDADPQTEPDADDEGLAE